MDVEFFTADGGSNRSSEPGEAAFLAFTGNHDGRGARGAACAVLRWNGSLFEAFQELETTGGYDAEAFHVDSGARVLLAVVHERCTDVYSASAAALRGVPPLAGFALLQRLEVPHGRDAEHFGAGGADRLVLAVFRDDASHEVDSRVYRWSSERGRLEEEQRLRTSGAFDAELVEDARGSAQLLLANQRSGVTRLYSWSARGWVEEGAVATAGVYDLGWHRVRESGIHFLGVARFWE